MREVVPLRSISLTMHQASDGHPVLYYCVIASVSVINETIVAFSVTHIGDGASRYFHF